METTWDRASNTRTSIFTSSKQSLLSRIVAIRPSSLERQQKALETSGGCPETPLESALSIFPKHGDLDPNPERMRWYTWWLDEQLKTLPTNLLSIVTGHRTSDESQWSPQFAQVFLEIAKCARSSDYPSIGDIVDHLTFRNLIVVKDSKDSPLEARSLVFAVFGWQTMLYRPALGTCPPQQLAVIDEQDGYRGQAFMALKQHQMSAKRPLHEFLMGFGILVPPSNFCTSVDPEEKKAFQGLTNIGPSNFNAYLLDSLGHIKIKWVEVVSCHLEYDERAKILYLFRYPSFCVECLITEGIEKGHQSVIRAAVSPPAASRQWGIEEDVKRMLEETLLSYRLLFGQDKHSRKLFKNIEPFAGIPAQGKDLLLASICGSKSSRANNLSSDKDFYDLQQDFPILRSRLARLHKALSASKPRSWRELWQDKRDSAGWFTFWAVLIFGGIAIMLSFLQVVLQILQIAINR